MRALVLTTARKLAPPSLAIPLVYLLFLLVLSRFHDRFDEWGGVMQFFAGQELVAGQGYRGWASHFWPPMFSILIGLAGHFVPPFLAGKLISILASTLLVVVTYHLAMQLSGDRRVALWSQAFLAINPLYVRESIGAHNHLLEPLFLGTGLWLTLAGMRQRAVSKQALAGIMCGLAGLARYTSYALLALPCFLLYRLRAEPRRAAALALAFWAGFAVVSMPWWYEDTKVNGSPLHSWEALNVCSAVLTNEPHTLRSLWWCSDQPFNGVLDIARAHPIDYLRNVKGNIGQAITDLAKSAGVLAPFAIPAIFGALFLIEPVDWLVLFGGLAIYLGLVVQAHSQVRYLLPWVPLMTIVSVALLLSYLDRCRQHLAFFTRYRLAAVLMIFLWVVGAWVSRAALVSDLREERTSMPLSRIRRVTKELRAHDPDLRQKTIMATEPVWAFYARSRYLATPLIYDGSVEGLAQYEGLSPRVRAYAPKYPADLATLRADYLVYTMPGPGGALSQFTFLFNPTSDQIPRNFNLVFQSAEVVVYRIDWSHVARPSADEPAVRPVAFRARDQR